MPTPRSEGRHELTIGVFQPGPRGYHEQMPHMSASPYLLVSGRMALYLDKIFGGWDDALPQVAGNDERSTARSGRGWTGCRTSRRSRRCSSPARTRSR